ncbi:MAG: hypothetical protein J5496_06155 [Lachnospiraceae bacterium]|nr:hypothetical protein [Lachnospiraceae bacterium]
MLLTWIYRGIALLILVLTGRELWKEEKMQMKLCACFVMIPLLLRVLMIK